MKQSIIYYLFTLVVFSLVMVACQKIDAESFTPEDPSINFDQQHVTVGNDVEEIELEINANLPWRIRTDAAWITLIKANGTAGEKAKIAVQRNRTTEERTAHIIAYITDASQTELLLTQAAGDPPPDYTRHFYVKTSGTAGNDGLSWAAPTTLDKALDEVADGDFIHIAAGTYAPTTALTGGTASDLKEYTFEIRANVQIIGGYPTNAQEGAIADPENSPTVLSGNLGSDKARHVVAVTAVKAEDQEVSLKGLTIRDGNAGGSGNISVNGTNFSRAHGGGIIIGGAKVLIDNCQIIENTTANHAAGMYITNQAVVTIKNSSISKNSASVAASNGGGIWNDGSTLYIYNSTVSENRIGGVGGGVYALNTARTTYTYMYNVTIANNVTGIFGANSAAPGYYGRELSEGVMVNCTIYGNTAGGTGAGGGIRMHGSAKLNVFSSTITNNAGGTGSGIDMSATGTNEVNLFNTIVAGNTGAATQTAGNGITVSTSIVGSNVYDADGVVVAGATFDATTMLGSLGNHGGLTQTVLPIGTGNPALLYGLNLLQLQLLSINHNLEEDFVTQDQNDKSRTGKTVMGAALPL
ncbi:BACON domain-containing protein [Sphingobacterium sp. SGG-5]|uniref:BACON domain-containing protein n=1 Tax=Sphingobacterium sp. SGG-5 TaxID=2710881 RepID=UPI0019D2F9A5|nr:BACON domain-containing carbohydrate-binding protein [Sphingobacterium sp. SGG-5]